jgi:hypothetical protein
VAAKYFIILQQVQKGQDLVNDMRVFAHTARRAAHPEHTHIAGAGDGERASVNEHAGGGGVAESDGSCRNTSGNK